MVTPVNGHLFVKSDHPGVHILRLKGTPAIVSAGAPGKKMEALVYTANMLYLMSYFVQDMLKLRCLTVVAATCLVGYFWSQPEPLMTVIIWNLFFVALNILQIARIVYARKKAGMRQDGEPASGQEAPALLPARRR